MLKDLMTVKFTSLESHEMLIFAVIALATTSLGLLIKSQKIIAECNWNAHRVSPDARHKSLLLRLPDRLFRVVGLVLIVCTVLILLSTAMPEYAAFDEIRNLLTGIAFLIILISAVAGVIVVGLYILLWSWVDRILARIFPRVE